MDPNFALAMAIQHMLVAHIAAIEDHLPGTAQTTAKKADLKRRAAIEAGQPLVAELIESFVDELRERFGIPVND